MATVTPTVTDLGKYAFLFTWSALTTANTTGDAALVFGYTDKSVALTGTFSAAATVVVEGSHDNSTFFTLRDPLGNTLSFTSTGLKQILENVRYVRPRLSGGGDGSTSITATVLTTTTARG